MSQSATTERRDQADTPEPSVETAVATEAAKERFFEVVESDARICQNCFALREEQPRYFRSSGGRATGSAKIDDQTADIFCTECAAGTGKPTLYRPHEGEWDAEREEATSESGLLVNYDNVHCELGRRFVRDMGGTIEREWGEESPLPKNGEQVSFFRLLRNLRDRLEEKHVDVDWGRWKDVGARLKSKHPSRDRAVFARIVAATVPSEN